MKVLVDWETDGQDVDLPETVVIPDTYNQDEVADYLSDTYGWLVKGWCAVDIGIQCGSCEQFSDAPINNECPKCHSGNWVWGRIDNDDS